MAMHAAEHCMIAYLPEDLGIEETIETWPRHMIVMPWLVAPCTEVVRQATSVVERLAPIDTVVSDIDYFGAGRTPVLIVEPQRQLIQLHAQLVEKVASGYNWRDEEEWVGDDYVPHFTIKPWQAELQLGERLVIGSLLVIRKRDNTRTVAGRIYLKGEDSETAA